MCSRKSIQMVKEIFDTSNSETTVSLVKFEYLKIRIKVLKLLIYIFTSFTVTIVPVTQKSGFILAFLFSLNDLHRNILVFVL